ncbi:MAG: glucose 1-dehydrogenase [Gammaproteobacteria bacterium]|nr:glucose 1-dehydrogenase [Gammaproteobacteria bacterium]
MAQGRLAGKTIVVTGGASGIGRACAQRALEQGAKVFICDIAENGADVAAELGRDVGFRALDVADETGWQVAMAEMAESAGGLDGLINAAGIFRRGTPHNVENATLDDWRRVYQVNVEGVFLGCKYAIPAMRDSGGGSIVNISSLAGIIGSAHAAAYGSSKGAVRQFSKSVAQHCARKRYNIRCNSIHPGSIDTPMGHEAMSGVGATLEEGRERYRNAIPLRMIGEPDDIAYGALYLLSEEAKFVTGIELIIDGGVSMT